MRVRQLPESGNGRGVMLVCPFGHVGEYSPDRGDYFTADPDHVLRCETCDTPLILVRKVTRYEEIAT
jgi:hypothetical protein